MIDTTRTHRCPDCRQHVEHTPGELCGSCGRCRQDCACPKFHELTAQLELERIHGEGKVL